MDKTTAYQIFEEYYRTLQQQEQAVLPDERLAILTRMERELVQEGVIPLGQGEVAQFNVDHPTYAAILRGDNVSIGGEKVSAAGEGSRLTDVGSLPLPARIGLLLVVFLVPMLIFGGIMVMRERNQADEAAAKAEAEARAAATVAQTPTTIPTATTLPTAVAMVLATEPPPETATPRVTPTPLPISALRGAVAEGGSDPASVEIAGESFILSVGKTSNGIWLPQGAEWLAGSVVRRVVAIPYQAELMPRLEQVEGSVKLRLRSGEVIDYRIQEVTRYRRDQIEVMAAAHPSIAVIVYGQEGDERLVITGTAAGVPDDAGTQAKEVVATPAQ